MVGRAPVEAHGAIDSGNNWQRTYRTAARFANKRSQSACPAEVNLDSLDLSKGASLEERIGGASRTARH